MPRMFQASDDKPRSRVALRDFKGLKTNIDPFERKDASEVQSNITCIVPGQLTVRSGMRTVNWEN